VIFGKLQHYFVVNISANSILNKLIAQMTPASNKIKNSVFHLQITRGHCIKILTPIFPNFGTIQQCDILNMSINFIFIECLVQSNATWQKTTNRYSVIMND